MKGLKRFWKTAFEKRGGAKISELSPLFDVLWERAVEQLPASVPQGVKERLKVRNFPARLIVLALGKAERGPLLKPDDLEAILEKVKTKPRFIETGRVNSLGGLRTEVGEICVQGADPGRVFQGKLDLIREFAEAVDEVSQTRGLSGKFGGPLLRVLITEKAAGELGQSEREIQGVLGSLLSRGDIVGKESALFELIPLAAKEIGVPFAVDKEEALTVARLLVTGEVFRDAAFSVKAVLHTVPELLLSLPEGVVTLPETVIDVAKVLPRDFIHLPLIIVDIIGERAGLDLRRDEPALQKTLQELYDNGTFSSVARLIHTLLDQENESLRLALVLYAKVNGLPLITPETLDMVRDSVFNPDNPGQLDLTPALEAGVNHLVDRYKGEAGNVLENIGLRLP